MNLNRYAATVIRGQVIAILRDLSGVRQGKSSEPTHRLRVTCRRLHNAFQFFEAILPETVRPLDKEIRRLLKDLGPARDRDVQIIYFQNCFRSTRSPKLRQALSAYLGHLRKVRQDDQVLLRKALDRLKERRTLSRIRGLASRLEAQDTPRFSERTIQRNVRSMTAAVLRYERFVGRPEKIDALHRMRIAAKHLRYTLESLAPLYGRKLRAAIKDILRLHDLLGDLHDDHVWVRDLQDFSGKEEDAEIFGPMFRKLNGDYRRSHRAFVRAWDETQRKGLWKRLGKFSVTVS